MSEETGVYKRGDIWWYRVGRTIRRSSRSRNMHDAIAMRERALAIYREGAVRDEWREWVSAQQGDSNSWLRRTHSHMRRRTRIRGWADCISMEELVRLVRASNGACALTGLPFSRTERKHDPFSISVDRIDSRQGYCAGNVRLVLLAVNLGMSHWGEDAFRVIARALVGRELVDRCTKR